MQMMRHLIAPAVLAFTMASAASSKAADLGVNGRIRAGGACSIAVGNGGVIDLGDLSFEQLANVSYMRSRDVPLTINCQRQTKVGVKAIDNRKDSAHGYGFGLGNPAIGGYEIYPELNGGSAADGRQVYLIHGHDNDWGRTDASWSPDGIVSWGIPDAEWEPVAFKTLTTSLYVIVNVKKDDIMVTDVLEIDGSATLELVYL
ncbi:DUF1120 domain-containing protein [Burkholderia seminalis]|uniref:DUF1120 domain-containing protein n=1 Tax=Burkholderia seminalis TaxID=488731 RepID=UPI001904BF76|nr:DUF1120 domain-containing protein [Burkholderia seminalis]MBJ9967244.1 DUF1120 domain-containing protein [Burkholderia seminalis]